MKEEQGEGYLMKRWVSKKLQQVMGKMKRVQKMLGNFQQVVNKINGTLEVQGKLGEIIGKVEKVLGHSYLQRQVGPWHNQSIDPLSQ